MKKKAIFLSILVVLLMVASQAMAWRTGGAESCSNCLANLDMTTDQSQKLDSLRDSFLKETIPLRNEKETKKLEMRILLAKPSIDIETVKAKQQEIFDVKKSLQEKSLDYYLKARKVLTPQQVSMLPPGCHLGFNIYGGAYKSKGCGSKSGQSKGGGPKQACPYQR
ncbi:MAG: hypothetical protein GY864_06545 [Desulfobacterales bacterium]|nr:hypothetical protein [Desulfobacterales bacterium]